MENVMSFRKKNRQAEQQAGQPEEEQDVKVVHAQSDDSGKQSQSQQAQPDQQADQAAQQPEGSDQAAASSAEQTDDEQSDGDGEDDDSDDEPVPVGTTAEILRWVGSDQKRAQRALDKERAEEKPRRGLTGELEEILSKG
jgi:hypothetical protein